MVELLVSVRNPQEALAALEGGANWIDVKEPANGPLGMANGQILEQILETLPPFTPTSAALGEAREFILDDQTAQAIKKYRLIKIGLSKISKEKAIAILLSNSILNIYRNKVILASYADHGMVRGLSPWGTFDICVEQGFKGLLIDTFQKKGKRLFDWLDPKELTDLSHACREKKIRFGLAGSLQIQDLDVLVEIMPDLIGIRGAACADNHREGQICSEKVRLWKNQLSLTATNRVQSQSAKTSGTSQPI